MMETNHTLHADAALPLILFNLSLNGLIPAEVLRHQCFTSCHLQQHLKQAGSTTVHALPAMTVMQISCLGGTRNV